MIVLAGRRIDGPDAKPARFPLDNVPLVRARIREFLETAKPKIVISSGACGADLIAQGLAADLNIRGRLVLPFTPDKFRVTSVTDRPGNWGSVFDCVLERAKRDGDLVIVSGEVESDESYAQANERMLDEAAAFAASPTEATAVVVWEGSNRGPDDLTDSFRTEAIRREFKLIEILTA